MEEEWKGLNVMSDQDTFERILASLYDAMLDDAEWPAASALIDDACGTVGNALLVADGPPDDIQTQFAGLYYRGQHRADLEREWLAVYHPINECIPRFLQLPDSQMVLAPDLYTAEELKTSRAYNEGLRRLSGQQSVMVRLDGPNGCVITWVSGDPAGTGGWDSSQRALLQGLLPISGNLSASGRRWSAPGRGAYPRPACSAIPRSGPSSWTGAGCIVEANDCARTILLQGDVVKDRDGELRACHPADHARLARLIAGAVPTSSAPAVSGSMTLRRASVLPLFVVHVKPVRARQPDFGARRAAALVLITGLGAVSPIDPILIAELLGLTKVEGEVAVWVTEGRSVREIAGALGQTAGAVRWYLHQIYRKHGLARQADVVRLVLSVAPLV